MSKKQPLKPHAAKRVVVIGDCILYQGDCLELMPDSIDHVITDPPYEDRFHKKKSEKSIVRTDGGPVSVGLDFDGIDAIRPALMQRVAANCDGWFIAFCTPEGIAPWCNSIKAAGARYKRALFWYKPDGAPQFNGQGPGYYVECMVAAWCGRGYSKWNGGGGRNIFTHPKGGSSRDGRHPTEKPLALMCELVEKFTQPGDLVCDPFMGSGTTGVACAKMGQRFIGIELDPRYFDIACERIRKAYAQPDLFLEKAKGPEPKQEPLFRDEGP